MESLFQDTNEFEEIRAREFFNEHRRAVYKRTDRIFAYLLPIQWLASIAAAAFLSPLTWNGDQSSIHPHVWFAIFAGGVITSLPLYLTIFHPGETATRHVVAVSQMLMSALLVHITGGRVETHFHIFGSLAFLGCYRDWRVLISATVITAADHFMRGWLYPFSIYGVLTGAEWRWLEHAGWVIFTDIFLIISCIWSAREMRQIAQRAAIYTGSEERYRAVVEQTTDGIVLMETEGLHVIECNEAFSQLIGCETTEEAKTLTGYDFATVSREELNELTQWMLNQQTAVEGERTYRRRDGSTFPVDISASLIAYNGKQVFSLNVKDITNRNLAEKEMKRLALVAQKTQNSVIVCGPEGFIEWVNEGFTRVTGYKPDEVIGKSPILLAGEQTSAESLAEFDEAIDAHRPFEGELYNYKKDGTGYWVSISLMPVTSDNGEVHGYVFIETDITERKAMEEKLRTAHTSLECRVMERTRELEEAQEFLHAVIDNVPSLIFVKDIKGRYVLGNQALAKARGTTVKGLTGKTRADFGGNPDEVQKFTDRDIDLLENLADQFIPEEKHTDADGAARWYQTAKRSIALGKNGAKFIVGASTDITERKKAEAKLGDAQQFLRNVIDNVPNLIFVKDPEGRFTLVNRPLAKMYGTTAEKLLGKTDDDFGRPPDEVEQIATDQRKIVEDFEEIVNHEEKLTDSKGNVHWMQTVKRPMFGDEGVEYILGISTDLTERKLLETTLQHSQKMESIGQLAAGIAHEINTPTQWVGDNTRFVDDAFTDIGLILEKYNELLDSSKSGVVDTGMVKDIEKEIIKVDLDYLSEEIPRALKQSLDGVSRIAKIVQSMKDFAHPGAREKQSADLNRAIESTITVASNEWKYVAEIQTEFDETLPLVQCFLGEFNQVILNMVINAAHAITDVVGDGSQGKGKITITTARVGDSWAEVRIGDTGGGIPAAIRGRVFDPFFTTKEVGRGTGQGLAISHTVVVEKHGGQLTFETEQGHGTTFIIRLPLPAAEPQPTGG